MNHLIRKQRHLIEKNEQFPLSRITKHGLESIFIELSSDWQPHRAKGLHNWFVMKKWLSLN